jgi:hypothetical protein
MDKFSLSNTTIENKIRDLQNEVGIQDWKELADKIEQGKAHELSEGDTLYLGACRKGAGGEKEKLREQPNSSSKAKSRAFSFKPEYLNSLLTSHLAKEKPTFIPTQELTFEQITINRFKPYLGKTINEIGKEVGYIRVNPKQKAYEAELAKRMDAILNADKPQVDVFKVIELVKRDQTTTEEISEVDDFETYIDEQKDPSEMTPAELRKYKFEQWRRRIGS